jgi:hypothetical protein
MFAFVPTGLAPWEVVAFSALCALSALTIALGIGATVAYFGTHVPRAARQSTPARASQRQTQMPGAIAALPHATPVAG